MIYFNNKKLNKAKIGEIEGGEGKCEIESQWVDDGTVCQGVDLYNTERLQIQYNSEGWENTQYTKLTTIAEPDCAVCKFPTTKAITVFDARDCNPTDASVSGKDSLVYYDNLKNKEYIAKDNGYKLEKGADNSVIYRKASYGKGIGDIQVEVGSFNRDNTTIMFKFKNSGTNDWDNRYMIDCGDVDAGIRGNEIDFETTFNYNFVLGETYEVRFETDKVNKKERLWINDVLIGENDIYGNRFFSSFFNIFSYSTIYQFSNCEIYYLCFFNSFLTEDEIKSVKSYFNN